MNIERFISHNAGIVLRKILPENTFMRLEKLKIEIFGRPYIPAETSKAKPRRIREGFFD